jgi:hypothetical protein
MSGAILPLYLYTFLAGTREIETVSSLKYITERDSQSGFPYFTFQNKK